MFALIVLLSVLLPACGGVLAGGRDAVTIYSGRGSSLIGPLLEEFSASTGIPIDVRYGGSAELALLIAQEGDRTPADVFYSQSPGAVGFLAGEGRLAPLDPGVLELVDQRFRDDGGLWVGVSGRQRVLVYNTELVSELPTSVFEVVEEPFAGRVAVAPSNGSFQDFITAMRVTHGDEVAARFLQALATTGAPSYANNNAIVEAVARGEVPMGLVNHYYLHRFLAEDPDLPAANHRFAGDDIGSLLIASSVSVLEGTDEPEGARRLVEYLLDAEAQQYFAEETFEYPLALGTSPVGDVPPLDTLEVPAFDIDRLGGGLERTLELIRDSGLDG
ncbi:MAG: extracellular solute-binding protein [Actinobacteria bacterium]|nr:extracellular solute-binding protein [Actinomycetota bacterium]